MRRGHQLRHAGHFFADFSRLHASLLAAVDLREYFSKQITSMKTVIPAAEQTIHIVFGLFPYGGLCGKSGFCLDS